MNKLEQLVQSPTFKKFMTRIYGIGASVVVVGALFKIEHWPGASIMLSTGLFTEAIIFFLFAFDATAQADDHAEGAAHGTAEGAAGGGAGGVGVGYAGGPAFAGGGGYGFTGGYGNGLGGAYGPLAPQESVVTFPADGPPGLYFNGGEPVVGAGFAQGGQMDSGAVPLVGGSSIALARLDDLLQQADISPDLLSELGKGLHKLGESLSNMAEVGNVSEASRQYLETIQAADASLGRLSKAYEDAISNVTSQTLTKYSGLTKTLDVIEKQASTYRDEMVNLTSILTRLNTLYAQQRREESDYLRELVVATLESKKYRQQVSELNEHLAVLNKHYAGVAKELKAKKGMPSSS